jgi:hypothetical protein
MSPSKALVKARAAAVTKAVAARREALGVSGLAACKHKISAALASNIPQPLPTDADGRLCFYNTRPTPCAAAIPSLPVSVSMLDMPRELGGGGGGGGVFVGAGRRTVVQVVRANTAFHTVDIGFDCRELPRGLRPWLILLQVPNAFRVRGLGGSGVWGLGSGVWGVGSWVPRVIG